MPSALAGAEAAPAYWLRGLHARADTHPLFASLGGDGGWCWVGRDWEDCVSSDGTLTLFGDGSGGQYSDDPRRRR
eukprot:9027867-Pyramimonas_sp.AAC.1